MGDFQWHDGREADTLAQDALVAASAIAQFYDFASRCMDWAKTTRSLQERAVYTQMALQWLAAGARLQTLARFKVCHGVRHKEAA